LKKYLLILIPIVSLLLGSCKKDAVDYTGFETIDPNSSYLLSKKGTYWKYETDFNGTKSTNTITLTGNKTTINGKNYLDYTGEAPGQPVQTGYYYMGNHQYNVRASAQGYTLDILYLVDNYEIGQEWTGPINDQGTINGIPGRVRGKILEKGITMEVLGKKYTGVYHTQAYIEYNLFGNGFENFGTYDYYIAKGVGLIEIDSELSGFSASSKLMEYTIK
jgi:hypothetical protein